MNPSLTAILVTAFLLAAVWLGVRLQRLLPEHHLSSDTKDTVKLAMGLVATMSALVLGLLVSSAKSSYDTTRGEVIQMAAKIAFLDRVLAAYGPEAAAARAEIRSATQQVVRQIWSPEPSSLGQLASHTASGNAVYAAIQSLSPNTDIEKSLKAQALSLSVELAQLRTLLLAQSAPSISAPLLIMLVAWLFVIFLSFSLLAPSNATAALSLAVAALSVAGAILLILELDRPLSGLLRVSSEVMTSAVSQLEK